MYLCEVAIVSQLCISFPYVLHGLCEDYLTCNIAFNAVMPLSHASTRGRYSRIVGVTVGIRAIPDLGAPCLIESLTLLSLQKNVLSLIGLYILESRILFTPQFLRHSGEAS